MSDVSQGPGWWLASDGKWYPPELAPGAQPVPTQPVPTQPYPQYPPPQTPPQPSNNNGCRNAFLVALALFILFVVGVGACTVIFADDLQEIVDEAEEAIEEAERAAEEAAEAAEQPDADGGSIGGSVGDEEPDGADEPASVPEAFLGDWRLASVNGEEIVVGVNTESPALITIDATSVSGDFGCNGGAAELIDLGDGRLQGQMLESEEQLCSIPDGSEEMVLSERAITSLLESAAGFTITGDSDQMTWSGTGFEAVFVR